MVPQNLTVEYLQRRQASAHAAIVAGLDPSSVLNDAFEDIIIRMGGVSPLTPTTPSTAIVDDADALPANDPRNKAGKNLTERGAELVYRMFDQGYGYNRVSREMGITQTAARHRKGKWESLGGVNRIKPQIED